MESEHGGVACPTDVKETQACKVVECPIDCAYDSWSEWGTCDSSCGPGTSTRNRVVGTPAQFNGAACEGGLEEARDCEIKPCPVDCELEAWEDAGECSEPCGTGQLKQTRAVKTDAAHGGSECGATEQHVPCNPDPCPVDCVLSDWKDDGSCTVTEIARACSYYSLYVVLTLAGGVTAAFDLAGHIWLCQCTYDKRDVGAIECIHYYTCF